jgi:hypothetical protein
MGAGSLKLLGILKLCVLWLDLSTLLGWFTFCQNLRDEWKAMVAKGDRVGVDFVSPFLFEGAL